ncbi:putative transcriptional regulator [Streptococcus suis]|nr:helix-turn-helix transcriptional regulator [Streptococcus suis]CYV15390.1 putative transcriptional regulator [Streptococcus suis]CYV20610.1 putative transcriptional regulator [Streptococcus suis]
MMENASLRQYIGKRIRHLRLEKGWTQDELEEKADLGMNYAYKIEQLATNIKIDTFERILEALETDIEHFFDISIKENSPELSQLLDSLSELPKDKQEKSIKAFQSLLEQMK